MRAGLYCVVLLLGSLLFVSRPACAQDGTVAIGGQFLFKIRASAEGKTAEQRADDVTERLPDILGDTRLTPDDITVEPAKGGLFKIMVKQHLLVTVTPADGQVNQKTAQEQADIWAEQARQVLPQVNAQSNPNEIQRALRAIRGTVSYRERIALPPNAVLRVRLLDVSSANAPSVTVAQKRIPITHQVPISFELPYHPETIKPQHTYVLDARILVAGKLRWVPATRHPVITHGNPRKVDILLVSVPSQH
jgi:putative lipoprotein